MSQKNQTPVPAQAKSKGPTSRLRSPDAPHSGSAPEKADVIYLGIDTHADHQVVVVQVDATTPKPAQRFSLDGLLKFAKRQLGIAHRVVACYEAGPCGYTLHRELTALGIEAMVVRPKCWDEYGNMVKTDARDARALCEALERYSRGNSKALSVIRVPSVEEEQARNVTRQREALVDTRKRVAAQGRSAALFASHRVRMKGHWWRPRAWARWQAELTAELVDLLTPLRIILEAIDVQIEALTEKIVAKEGRTEVDKVLPKAVGELTHQVISNEVCDWNRFHNRQQVSSITGLCPSEYSSGGKRRQGGVNKHGNPLLRRYLCEAVWRMMRYQPGWIRLKAKEGQPTEVTSARKKKKVAALARVLAIDLWRLNTGRTTLEALGLIPATNAA